MIQPLSFTYCKYTFRTILCASVALYVPCTCEVSSHLHSLQTRHTCWPYTIQHSILPILSLTFTKATQPNHSIKYYLYSHKTSNANNSVYLSLTLIQTRKPNRVIQLRADYWAAVVAEVQFLINKY